MKPVDEVIRAVYRKDLDALARMTADEVNARDRDGRTPLMHAVLAEDADPAVVSSLIDRGADVDVADTGEHWTALHFAARDRDEPVVRRLLEAGAAVDPVDAFGNTPLWRSVNGAQSHEAAIEALLAHGAQPCLANRYGISPLDLARETGQDDVVALLDATVRRDEHPPGD